MRWKCPPAKLLSAMQTDCTGVSGEPWSVSRSRFSMSASRSTFTLLKRKCLSKKGRLFFKNHFLKPSLDTYRSGSRSQNKRSKYQEILKLRWKNTHSQCFVWVNNLTITFQHKIIVIWLKKVFFSVFIGFCWIWIRNKWNGSGFWIQPIIYTDLDQGKWYGSGRAVVSNSTTPFPDIIFIFLFLQNIA